MIAQILRFFTIGCLGAAAIYCFLTLPMAVFLAIMAGDSGTRPATLFLSLLIFSTPIMASIFLGLCIVWLESQPRYYFVAAPVVAAGLAGAIALIGPLALLSNLSYGRTMLYFVKALFVSKF